MSDAGLGQRLEEAKRGRSYEADVVKAPMVFSDLDLFLRLADASEERANSCQKQKTVTCQCAAKLGRERNGINGRGPRSGKQTVYAGFDLDQASLRTAWLGLCREPLDSMLNGLWHLDGALGTIILPQDLRSVLGRKSFTLLLFWNVSRPKLKGYPSV